MIMELSLTPSSSPSSSLSSSMSSSVSSSMSMSSSLSSTPSSTPSSSPLSTPASSPLFQTGLKSGKETINICVEGNIGCGKTMLLDYLSSLTDEVQVSREPVNTWRNVHGHNLLDLMYQDPQRWSFAFQSYAQLSMLRIHQSSVQCPVKMIERSVFSGKYCFIESLHRSGRMSHAEYSILTELFDWNSRNVKVDQIIYLRSSPEHCQRRILQRNRGEETGISMDYLSDLHQLHEDWLIHHKFPVPAPVRVIDANRSLKEMQSFYRTNMDALLTPATSDVAMEA